MEISHKNYFLQKSLKFGGSKLRLCRISKYLDPARAIFTYTKKVNHERLEKNKSVKHITHEKRKM